MPEIVSVASLPMKDVSQAIAELKSHDAALTSTPNLKASFRGVSPDDPYRLELASVWASEADNAAAHETEAVKKFISALKMHEDETKASIPGAKLTGVIINSDAGQGSFEQVAASPIVHIGTYRVPAAVAKADFEAAWLALCSKAGPPAGAVAGPVHGWVKDPKLPDGSDDNLFVVTGGWQGRDAYEAIAKDPEHPSALPPIGQAAKGEGKFAVFEKTK